MNIQRLITSLTLMVAMLCIPASMSARDDDKPEIFIVCEMDKGDIYEHQPVPVVVTLVSSDPDIAFVKRTDPIALKKGEFDTFQTITPAGDAYEKTIEGRKFYCFPLDAYMISMADKGKYDLTGGEYLIGVNYYEPAVDRFGRRVRARKVRQIHVPVEKKQFKVKSLPEPPASIDFSGSVGQFTIETVVPRGDIYIDEEATAYIMLKGSGMVAEATLPEYRDAFHKGVKLKSVSESRDEGHIRGKMMTEIQLECTFIPTDRNEAEIGEIRFDYFDPSTGKYATAVSKPVRLNVKSSTAKRENIAI